jgi:hypothetical protein
MRFEAETLHLVGSRSTCRVAGNRLLPASKNSFDQPWYIDEAMPSPPRSSARRGGAGGVRPSFYCAGAGSMRLQPGWQISSSILTS